MYTSRRTRMINFQGPLLEGYIVAVLDTEPLASSLAEEKLRESEERFRSLFEENPVACHEIDRDGIVRRVNRAECTLLGFDAEDILGQPIWLFVTLEERDRSREAIGRKMSGEQPLAPFEREYQRRDGARVALEIHENLLRNPAGEVVGIRSTMLDITERRNAERALAQYAEELARSNAELEQFAYVASHDLQEPLRMIGSYTQLLARRYRGKLGADADDFIHYAVDGATRLQTLINDLLAYSQVVRQGRPMAPVSIREIFDAALQNLEKAIEESGAQVTCGELPVLDADRTQMLQLFQNLLGNGIKFRGDRRPEVRVEAVREKELWLFSVRDNGIGIDPQFSDRIFVIFQRLHSRSEYSGNGIGLSICKRIVERHGGRIWVDSQPGHGSTFHFTFPVHP